MTELKPEFSEARAAIGRQQITTPAGYNSPVKITNDPLSARQAAQVNQLNDLISLLKRMKSLPARVVSDARGQLLLATQLGNIQPQNQLPLQPGQQVQLLLDATTGKPKVVPVRPDNAAVRLPVDGNRELCVAGRPGSCRGRGVVPGRVCRCL